LSRHGHGSRWLPPLIAALVVFAALTVLRLVLSPPAAEPERAPRELRFSGMLGCWELDVGDWEPAAGGSGIVASADSATGALLAMPDRVLLLPDSIDEWRREAITYRAVPVEGTFDPALRGRMRWFLRADTLWIVWSDRSVRAGLALLSGETRLQGGGRAVVPRGASDGQPLDVRAPAAAWKVNCATGLRDLERTGPRP
jgi:hypothetical protein